MPESAFPLSVIFDGWDGYNTSLIHAIQPLSAEQLAWRPAAGLRSVGEADSHLALGRVGWFVRMDAPGSRALWEQVAALGAEDAIAKDKAAILHWLEASWQMVAGTLAQWTAADLARTFRHEYQGTVYAVPYQWVIYRILTHDVHHGGELALMLGMQGIPAPELGDLFGHITMPPLAGDG